MHLEGVFGPKEVYKGPTFTSALLFQARDDEFLCICASICLLVYFIVPPNTRFRVYVTVYLLGLNQRKQFNGFFMLWFDF